MADELYAPNQQLVRPDGSGPAEEGTGGSEVGDPQDKDADDLDAMTKADLLDYATAHGIDADDSMTKAQIRDAIGS